MTLDAFPARKVYVPAATRSAVKKTERPAQLPKELALKSARDAFRDVAWTGERAPEPVPTLAHAPPAEPLSPIAQARAVFASIPWGGERPAPATPIQSAASVKTVLDSFKWE